MCSGRFDKTSRSGPQGTNTPMGHPQDNRQSRNTARPLRPRDCLRKGCGRVFQPARWNQRYCQQAECTRQVRRWQAAKRQRAHRQSPANRKRHAQAEANRRQARAAQPAGNDPVADKKTGGQDRAWSRSKEIPAEFCDRPGCYEPLPDDSRAPARYCGPACRLAMRRVRDRERKWLMRNRYHAGRDRRGASQAATEQPPKQQPLTAQKTMHHGANPVGDYSDNQPNALSCWAIEDDQPPRSQQGALRDGHSQTNPHRRPRPPPA